MTSILKEIIDIKLEMISIFEKQILLLGENKIKDLLALQEIEQKLIDMLEIKKETIKQNKNILVKCEDYALIDLLKDVCIKFESKMSVRQKLIERASFINKKILECISKAIVHQEHEAYNNTGCFARLFSANSIVINTKV